MMASDKTTKDSVKQLVEERNFVALLSLFDKQPDRVRRYITRLAYHPDSPEHDAAIEAFKYLSHERSDSMEDFFLETIRRHLWAMNDEGANNDWSAPEIIGAVIAGNPRLFGQFFSYAFCAAADELMFQPSLVKAYGMVAAVDESIVAPYTARIDELRNQPSL